MTVILSAEQHEALKREGNSPVHVTDPEGQAHYVLLRVEDYERIRALVEDDDFDIRESYPLQEAVARAEGWDDPEMDVYNDYDSHHQPP